jgi:hypothetical protein
MRGCFAIQQQACIALFSSVSFETKVVAALPSPPHAVPDALALPGHDSEFGDRGMMPVFALAQNRVEIFADRQSAFAYNRDRRRRGG